MAAAMLQTEESANMLGGSQNVEGQNKGKVKKFSTPAHAVAGTLSGFTDSEEKRFKETYRQGTHPLLILSMLKCCAL